MPAESSQLPISCSRLIVCEKSGDWANALRRTLPDGGRWIVETRSTTQLAAALEEHPASLCLIDVRSNQAATAAEGIANLHQQRPRSSFIAVADPSVGLPAVALREAGATFVVHSRRDADIVAQLWRAHTRIHPPREVTIRDEIFTSLPLS